MSKVNQTKEMENLLSRVRKVLMSIISYNKFPYEVPFSIEDVVKEAEECIKILDTTNN